MSKETYCSVKRDRAEEDLRTTDFSPFNFWQALPNPKPQVHEPEHEPEDWTHDEGVEDAEGGERTSSVGAGLGGRGRRKGGGKSENRIAGLKNEGATCYLNAVIQVMCEET